jgi:two-component system copper resistance phosphate regulon response regulator CusR
LQNRASELKILLVEDDEVLAQHLTWGLGQEGFEVLWAKNGLRGLEMVFEFSFSLIILDLMLPKLSGWRFIGVIREEKIETPILILSALDQVEHRVKGLEAGADDYLIKPFALSELSARVRAVLRRGSAIANTVLVHGDLTLDTKRHAVNRGGRIIELTPREYRLLTLLIEMKDQILSRGFILERVWDFDYSGDGNVVDVGIRRLRAKIDDDFETKLIHTIRGRGYVFR